MGKEVLQFGALAFVIGSTFYSYGITSEELTKAVNEVNLTDTFTPGRDKEYKTGRREITATVNIWKQIDEANPPIGTVVDEGVMDFEGYVYYGTFEFTEIGDAASVDEGISQAYTMRFTGEVFEAMDNIVVGGGGYGTTDWDDPSGDFTKGTGISMTAINLGDGDEALEMEVTSIAVPDQYFIKQDISFPVASSFLFLAHFHLAQHDIEVRFDSAETESQYTFPATTKRMLYFKKFDDDVALDMIRIQFTDLPSTTLKIQVDNINAFSINP